jgi:hypothetical protein
MGQFPNTEVKRTRGPPCAGWDAAAAGVNISGGQINARDIIGGNQIIQEAPPVSIPALHQLRPPPRDFTGREKEIAELLAAVEKGGVTISGLQGLGGVGKTALADELRDACMSVALDLGGWSKPAKSKSGKSKAAASAR